tara:strand:- start:316 stop:939 length:624 start_codon:yes stop_codon:yes gene_type:complete
LSDLKVANQNLYNLTERIRHGGQRSIVMLTLSVTALTLAACDREPVAEVDINTIQGAASLGSIVVNSESVLTFADFKLAGVKHGKDYNINGLPKAVSATLGFHDRKDVEIRFYPNHEIAIEQGVPIALEIVGPNVELKRESVTWSWPIADERACAARVPGGGRDCTNSPKYGDFIVYGNVIMFCEASTPSEAHTRCQAIIDALTRSN